MIGMRHFGGTPERCHHFFKAASETPKAEAARSMRVRRSLFMVVSRDDLSRVSTPMSRDDASARGGTSCRLTLVPAGRQWGMAGKSLPLTEWEQKFLTRTRALREREGLTQRELAARIGVAYENYRKYETRSPVPHEFIPRLCGFYGITEQQLFDVTGPLPKRARPALVS
jgi:hypothetical protein